MPDWKSPAELQKEGSAFVKLIHVLLGVYAYEWFLSLNFDFGFLLGKRKFRWPIIFYFANRYLLLFALVGIIISVDTTSKVDCQTLYTFNQIAGDAAIGLASINLSIRTMAIWSQNKYIIGLLVLIILGHWSLILQGRSVATKPLSCFENFPLTGMQLKVTWVDGVGCVLTQTNNTILAAIFIYSMCFDLIVLLLNTYKLLGIHDKANLFGRSRLARMIFEDGLIFFFIAFLANLCATVSMLLNLNQIMTVMFNVPAIVASSVRHNPAHYINYQCEHSIQIVACRAVRRLTNFTNSGLEVYSSAGVTGMAATRDLASLHFKSDGGVKSGVHVQMETFTHKEDTLTFANHKGQGSETDVDLDVEAEGSF
ncbi:uncharacterized protein LACBIDRAFT_308272 [Laccaria bicolor S238N-H82]|uniref:Predicted protein n=1 Tax=Laccaria bicolor (strain S238N-H82 / ATCC MYA-4686) TaxID=486041 RepID=B0DRZ3_LACBS|nr:uncharacterized protein LACBIDRAFT_308272 [Laccaria bicolor S238N-H82]EDR02612.1 predicted protein [Laccaria bicolor S238N-H82]|eukprot:XP_001886656.1 predicted protein [Laccaria bicolor S238N-H82]